MRILKMLITAISVIIFVGVMVSKDFRVYLGDLLSPVLDPMLGLIPFHIVIIILAVFTGLYTSIIQKMTINYERLKEIQKRVSAFQKEYLEATRKNNKAKLKRLEEQKDEIQKLQSEMMNMQLSSMIYIVVVTIPIFMWLYKTASLDFTIVIPFAGEIHTSKYYLILPWWLWWYMLNSFAFGQAIRKALKVGV